MPFLTPEQTAIRDMARSFVAGRIMPHAVAWDEAGRIPFEVVAEAGRLGLFGMTSPAEHGGSGADFLSYVLATEEIAAGDAGLANMINATNSYCLKIREFGSEAQKRRFMHPVAAGEALACMALTEPQAGSDAANLRTSAVRKGDRWVIDGTKVFVTSGQSAGYCCIIAVTDPAAGKRGISAFLTRTDKPGWRVLRHERKLGHRTNETCSVALDGLEVDEADMLGKPGEGLKVALQGLDSGRIAVAAQAIGVARSALEAAVAYAQERETFGKRIIEHQAVAFTLADMATKVEVARAMCHRAARLKQERLPCTKEASMAKLFASEMAEMVTSAAIQVHGGYGFIADYRVEKFYRDARVFQIYDGTNEIQKILIAREIAAGR
ncbi:MAG: acyl-CoA dehydrogenase family protein [Hyphomicrobiaceae bacterium]